MGPRPYRGCRRRTCASWASAAWVPGLSRTLVDLDDVCVTNINRQLPALDGQIGRPKVAVLAERVAAINPACKVTIVQEFFTKASADRLLAAPFDYVVDAIDRMSNKALLIAESRALGKRVLGEPRIGAHGTLIFFVHPKDMGGVLTEIMEVPAGGHN